MNKPALLVRLSLTDYCRNGVNLLVLAVVPGTFVIVASDTMARAATALGGDGTAAATITAGWAAGFVAAIGMYFLIAGNRATDRRLILSGLRRREFTAARMVSGLVIAVAAAAIALSALSVRTGVDRPWRTLAGTLMFAVIYAAIGAVAGVSFRDPVNGTVAILFTWIVDVFFGPAFTGSAPSFARLLPTHFLSLWMTALPSGHGDARQHLGWALAWTLSAFTLAAWLLGASTRQARIRRHPLAEQRRFTSPTVARQRIGEAPTPKVAAPSSAHGPYRTTLQFGVRQELRNRVLWLLLVAVPAVFVLMSAAITPARRVVLNILDGDRDRAFVVDLSRLHAGTMAPDGVAALAMLAGMFVVIASARADRRLLQAGMLRSAVRMARMATVALASVSATVASLLITVLVFDAANWTLYALANVLIALTFAALGVLLGPVTGRVAGVLLAFLIPFIDLGLGQSPMLREQPAGWAHVLPGYGGMRLMLDAALTPSFSDWPALTIALAWMIALSFIAAHTMLPARAQRAVPVH